MGLSASRDELLQIVGGSEVAPSPTRISFAEVEYDSREIKGGELFIALKGDATHGHQFLKTAFERGAALFLIEDRSVANDFPEPERLILVDDTLRAFSDLARWWRRKCALPVLAVTGSVGKTTVKEMVANVLLQSGVGAYSKKSFNNHVGVPYSITKISPHHKWAVLELGMNHRGEIATLTRIAEPDVSIVSIIGPAHIENLGSLEAITEAKLEIVEGTKRCLLLNAEDPLLVERGAAAAARRNLTLRLFGRPERAGGEFSNSLDLELSQIQSRGLEGISFVMKARGSQVEVTMSVMGTHNALNAAAAALGALELVPTLSLEEIARGLHTFKAPLMRLAVKELPGGRLLVDDSYNANPTSVGGLLDLAAEVISTGKRVGLILGDMRELGATSERYHRDLGARVGAMRPAFLVTVGAQAAFFAEEAEKVGVKVLRSDTPELAGLLALKMGFDILMVKGSRSVGLERAVATVLSRSGD